MKDWEKKRIAREIRLEETAQKNRVFGMQLFGIILCVAAFLVMGFTLMPNKASDVMLETVSVSPGDTLWGIAIKHPVDSLTTKETVAYIKEINNLSGTGLAAGIELRVPLSKETPPQMQESATVAVANF